MKALQQKYEREIAALVKASKQVSDRGYTSSHGGNLSFRMENDTVLITPTKVSKGDLEFNDIVIVDMNARILFAAPGRKPTGETPMHLHMFRKRPDLNAIVHSHPPVLTGFSIAHSDFLSKPLLPEAVIEIGPVLSVDYATPLSQKLADAFNAVMDYSNAFLMKNHGVMVCAREGIERAVGFTEMLENMAISLSTAIILGKVEFLTESDVKALEDVMRIRGMAFPGAPEKIKSLMELYRR